MSVLTKRVMCVGALVIFSLGVCRAVKFHFQEQRDAVYAACRASRQTSGLTGAALKARYPTPEIHMASGGCIMPGATGEVVIKGKFAPGSKFIFENDNIEVAKETLTPTEYRATLKVPPGAGPQTASVTVVSPVSCISARQDAVVVVGGKYEWTMNAANGWKVVARPAGGKACPEKNSAGQPYEVQFYRPGQAAPFERRSATLYFSMYDRMNYRFSVSQEDPASRSQQDELMTLMQRMGDPKLTNAQREEVMARLQKVQAEMSASLSKMTDPNYIKSLEAKKLEFGCERIELQAQGGSVTGEMRCSQKVGTAIALTGTMKYLGL
jgi:hypothetical protein